MSHALMINWLIDRSINWLNGWFVGLLVDWLMEPWYSMDRQLSQYGVILNSSPIFDSCRLIIHYFTC